MKAAIARMMSASVARGIGTTRGAVVAITVQTHEKNGTIGTRAWWTDTEKALEEKEKLGEETSSRHRAELKRSRSDSLPVAYGQRERYREAKKDIKDMQNSKDIEELHNSKATVSRHHRSHHTADQRQQPIVIELDSAEESGCSGVACNSWRLVPIHDATDPYLLPHEKKSNHNRAQEYQCHCL